MKQLNVMPNINDTVFLKIHNDGNPYYEKLLISGHLGNSQCFVYVNHTDRLLIIRWHNQANEFEYNPLLFIGE